MDTDRAELKLIRVGHGLWRLLRLEKRVLGQTVSEQRQLQRGLPTLKGSSTNRETECIEEAIQIIVRLKREKRAELKVERAARAQRTREHFAARRAA
jgi:hypothetical protein